MKTLRTVASSLMLVSLLFSAAFAQAGQTVNMTVGQFVADTFSVQDSNGAAVTSSNYTVSAAFSDPTIANYSNGHVNGVKLGTTTVTYTISGVAANGYTGSVIIGPDTINVNPKSLASASVSYSAPQ